MIDFFASAPQYLEHLAPVWDALAPDQRGFWLMTQDLVPHAQQIGIRGELPLPSQICDRKLALSGYRAAVVSSVLEARNVPTVVSSFGDLQAMRRWRSRFAFMEHGAGLSYGGDRRSARHPSYAGATDRGGVELFLVPGRYPAERNRLAHPDVPVVEVGCPKLDRWHGSPRPANVRPVVAFAWHWNCRVVPETRSAFPHFASAVRELAEEDRWDLLGAAHARADDVSRAYARAGIEQATLEQVMARADVLVADCTSALYEFAAATDRPVVAANAPWYRRDVDHGLRFWDAIPGAQVDDPHDLVGVITEALRDTAADRKRRRRGVAAAYTYHDGTSASRAAQALSEWAS